MKDCIRADLKLTGIHRDVLRLIRACLPSTQDDRDVLKVYRKFCELRAAVYPTTLREDRELLERVKQDTRYHWMY